jgi:peptide deformylase
MPGLQIVHYPHPALRWESKPVLRINEELRGIVQEMFELMYAAEGIGLAANQVGLPYRVFVLNLTGDPGEKNEEIVLINPEITKRKGTTEGDEGCLSFPKLYRPVRRAEEVSVEFFDLDGKGHEIVGAVDLLARAVQHELDHLDGVLFVDRVADGVKKEIAGTLQDFENLYRRKQELGEIPPDQALVQQLKQLEAGPITSPKPRA